MNEFINQYSEAFKLFQKHGFKNPIMYRSIEGEPNPDKVLFIVNDVYTRETQPDLSTNRRWRLKCDLQKYFKPEVYVLAPNCFNPSDLQPILDQRDRPTLLLTDQFCSDKGKQLLEEELVKIFGGTVDGKSPLFKRANEASLTIFLSAVTNAKQDPKVEEAIYMMQQVVAEAKKHNNAPDIVTRLKEELLRLEADVNAHILAK